MKYSYQPIRPSGVVSQVFEVRQQPCRNTIGVRFSAFDTVPWRKGADGNGEPEEAPGYRSAFGLFRGDLDAALLTQELPPDAFLDPDFRAWLTKQQP